MSVFLWTPINVSLYDQFCESKTWNREEAGSMSSSGIWHKAREHFYFILRLCLLPTWGNQWWPLLSDEVLVYQETILLPLTVIATTTVDLTWHPFLIVWIHNVEKICYIFLHYIVSHSHLQPSHHVLGSATVLTRYPTSHLTPMLSWERVRSWLLGKSFNLALIGLLLLDIPLISLRVIGMFPSFLMPM